MIKNEERLGHTPPAAQRIRRPASAHSTPVASGTHRGAPTDAQADAEEAAGTAPAVEVPDEDMPALGPKPDSDEEEVGTSSQHLV